MLDANIKEQLKAYMDKLQQPIELVAAYDDSKKSQELRELLEELEPMSSKISLRTEESNDVRRPSFAINRVGTDIGVRFAGIPMGHEFTSLVLALLQVGGHPPKVSDEMLEQIKSLDGEMQFETYYSLSCQNCPDVVQALNLLAIFNPKIRHVAIDGALFKDEVRELGRELGLPETMVGRHPFPGPGLAIRVPGQPLTRDKLDILRQADAIYLEEIGKAGLYDTIWQAFAVLLPVQTVGVMGDSRTYDFACALRAVSSRDGMTADFHPFDMDFLGRVANRIINEVRGINRVTYDVTSKPPGTIEWE